MCFCSNESVMKRNCKGNQKVSQKRIFLSRGTTLAPLFPGKLTYAGFEPMTHRSQAKRRIPKRVRNLRHVKLCRKKFAD